MNDERQIQVLEPEIVHLPQKEEDLMQLAEKRGKWMDELICQSLKRLRPGDINSMDGKPYINSDGCYKVARLWGISIHYTQMPKKIECKDKKGEYYFYVHAATVGLKGGESVDVVGNCSSRDPFYAKVSGEWRQIEDIDELDIMQKAQTATDRKGIAKLLGLNNITWDDIQKYAGITQQQCSNFSFKKPATTSPVRQNAGRPGASQAFPDKGVTAPEAEKQTPAAGPTDPVTDLRNEVLDLVKSAIAKDGPNKGKKIADVVKELSGGKVSLGLCNEEELSSMIDKLNSQEDAVTEVLPKKEVQLAFEFLYPVIEQRQKEDGYPWIAQSEGGEVCKRFVISAHGSLPQVYDHLREAFGGLEVFKLTEEGPRICWVMKRLKANGTADLTEDQKLEFQGLFNRGRHIGKTLRSARIRLGINGANSDDGADDEPIPVPGFLGDISIMLKRYQDLLQQKYVTEQKLQNIDKELEKYKPLASVVEAAKKTVQNIKENAS